MDEQGRAVSPRRTPPLPSGFITRQLLAYDMVATPSVVCRRDLVRQVGGFDRSLPTGEDYDLFLRLSLLCRFVALPEPLLLRRRHAGNISKQQRVQTAIRHAQIKERFCLQHPDLMTSWGRFARDQTRQVLLPCRPIAAARRAARDGRESLRRALRYRRIYPQALFWLVRRHGEPVGPNGGARIWMSRHSLHQPALAVRSAGDWTAKPADRRR